MSLTLGRATDIEPDGEPSVEGYRIETICAERYALIEQTFDDTPIPMKGQRRRGSSRPTP